MICKTHNKLKVVKRNVILFNQNIKMGSGLEGKFGLPRNWGLKNYLGAYENLEKSLLPDRRTG